MRGNALFVIGCKTNFRRRDLKSKNDDRSIERRYKILRTMNERDMKISEHGFKFSTIMIFIQ